MHCALWLNKRKVFSAEEIPACFDAASLRGYFLAGSLVPWLEDNGGKAFAEKLSGLSADDPKLNERLKEVFCGSLPASGKPAAVSPFAGVGGRRSFSCGSFFAGSMRLSTSYKGFGSGSMRLSTWYKGFGSGSMRLSTSYKGFGSGSMRLSTSYKGFGSGSMKLSTEYKGFGSGSIRLSTSYKVFGSGSMRLSTSYKGFGVSLGSYVCGSNGSFCAVGGFLPEDEYDKILMMTLAKCPLDRFGYGIHVLY